MSNRPRIALSAVFAALVFTIVDGAIHGSWSNRWSSADAGRTEAARVLTELASEDLGPWQLHSTSNLSDYALDILQCIGHINRTYVHAITGHMVNVVVILGPSGPTSSHTPEMCYTSHAYQVVEQRSRANVDGVEDDAFWSLALESPNMQSHRLRVMYAWSDGGPWSAPNEPRLTFARRPYLYKIQVASNETESDETDSDETDCANFLRQLLPILDQHLVSESALIGRTSVPSSSS